MYTTFSLTYLETVETLGLPLEFKSYLGTEKYIVM